MRYLSALLDVASSLPNVSDRKGMAEKPEGSGSVQHANPEERNRLVAGLRELANFLEEKQEVPAPRWTDILVFPSGSDDEMKREIDSIAALIGSRVDDETDRNLHYTTTRSFGPVSYRAVAIPRVAASITTLSRRHADDGRPIRTKGRD